MKAAPFPLQTPDEQISLPKNTFICLINNAFDSFIDHFRVMTFVIAKCNTHSILRVSCCCCIQRRHKNKQKKTYIDQVN